MIAFEVGQVWMKSPTFERIITGLLERSTDPVDRDVCTDSLVMNTLWVEKIPERRKGAVLGGLWSVLSEELLSDAHDDNMTAIYQIRQLRAEMVRRYRDLLTRHLSEIGESLKANESAERLQDVVLELLDESPISQDEVRADVRKAVAAGDIALAFEVMCGWIGEGQADIQPAYFQRLAAVAEAMDVVEGALGPLERVRQN
ncbi:MafI family immunity protein [Lentzea sp. NEAU-D7]|uniref:MafI family immunity protein n=1 Tax=Lentzea sp. NEAU-D7 TaxID=2994667 RepID=UPI00224AD120|nr:MafI family immunity protein [Lentzea sp. NEAU-D7]MCX2950162.1 MafI family immunity protein [Lentzea sp. NEAU-D7]